MVNKSTKKQTHLRWLACAIALLSTAGLHAAEAPAVDSNPDRSAFFGDLHIHTMFSFDAFTNNVRTTPDDAYRYAKGEPIPHQAGGTLRLGGPPLDFLMVSDHGEYMGVLAGQLDPSSPGFGDPGAAQLSLPSGGPDLDNLRARVRQLEADGNTAVGPEVATYAWSKIVEAAEQHNNPGKFTTFIGYEYTPGRGGRHMHRNVIFRGVNVPERPFTSNDSADPEDLWNWLDQLRDQGIEALAIPHNMNQSDGLAFQETTFKGMPIDRTYADKRMRNEPIAEISQLKGTSETHPSLSPNDEWAGFQIVQYYLNRAENTDPISIFKGGYYRDALKIGLEMQTRDGFNPYQLGAIGSSDTHVAAGSFDEDQNFSNGRNTPQSRGSAPADADSGWEDFFTPRQATHGTGGLAGVWADANTRDALFDAMRRRETFATSGPRMRVRFFGGYDFPDDITDRSDLVTTAYANGVPMGGMLAAPAQKAPSFLVWAARDPRSGWLQRVQIIKGWVANGQSHEAVFDVACSDGLSPDPTTHRCPDNGAEVNLDDCSVSNDKGAVELTTLWQDPDFDTAEHAFYYARVLENPSCRWSTWDALRLGIEPNPDLAVTHQERAWSSPIWYEPDA